MESLAGALSALEPLVLHLCQQATIDVDAYRRHVDLLEGHEELRAREALKHQYMAKELAAALVAHGAPPAVATTAAQLAVACYSSGRILATTPGDLVSETRSVFSSLLEMKATTVGA
ncbi:hypothetical protein [Rathayibacter sp. VKM Ac-2760]|uniref:hypothetical protein n=1 Tax=Rathayibacter sp. VKM Ac-2760 TaxID=2609253 RepID=UPI001FC98CF5|nr:hypothetical protein [Rathayibacter sp. VKM Ac-2760]